MAENFKHFVNEVVVLDDDSASSARITALEDKYVRALWFAEISTGTSGIIAPPTGGAIVLDQWAAGIDAVTSTITTGQRPDFITAKTSAGVPVTATLNVAGNWVVSGLPSPVPFAILYVYEVKLVDFNRSYSLSEEEVTQATGPLSTPSFADITDTGLTASLVVFTDATKKLISKTLAELKTYIGLGSAAYTDSTAYDVTGAAAAVTPTTLGLVIGTNVLAQRAFGSAANNNTGDFDAAGTAAGKIAASISDGDTTHAPDGNSVFDALALKAPVTNAALVTPTRTTAPADNDSSLALATTAFAKSQDAVLHREPNQAIVLTAGAYPAIKILHDAKYSSTTNNAGYGGVFAVPSWTPAATQILVNKWAANVGYKLELILTSGIFRLTLNATVYDSLVPGGGAASGLLAGSHHSILATPTVGASTTTVMFLLDGVLLNTTAAQANVDVTNTQDLYVGGTSAVTYAMTVYDVYHFNLAPSATEWRLAYLEGIPESWKWGSQTGKSTGTIANHATYTFETFDGASSTGFHGINSSSIAIASTPATISLVAGRKYRYRFSFTGGTINTVYLAENTYAGAAAGMAVLTDISAGTYTAEFVATITTPTATMFWRVNTEGTEITVSNFSLTDSGATLALESEGINHYQWQDSSSNQLHGLMPAVGSSLTRPKRDGYLDFTTGTTDQFLAGGTTRPILPVGNAIIEEIWAYSAGTPAFNLGDDAGTPNTLVASITLTAATWTKLPLLKNSTDHDDVYCDFTAGGAATRFQIKYRTISLA